MKSAYCAVRTECLNKTLRFAGFSTMRTGFQYQTNPYKICGEPSGTGTGPSLSGSTFPRKCPSAEYLSSAQPELAKFNTHEGHIILSALA